MQFGRIENMVYKTFTDANNLDLVHISPETYENVSNLILWVLLGLGDAEAEKSRQWVKWLEAFLLSKVSQWPTSPRLI